MSKNLELLKHSERNQKLNHFNHFCRLVITLIVVLAMKNKTRTSKVGAISKAQKAQNIFFGRKLVIFEKNQKSRIVPKNVKGGWDLLTYIQLQNMKKLEGTLLRH